MDQSTDFTFTFIVRDVNGIPVPLNSFTGVAQARKHWASNTSYAFTVVTASDGSVTLSMPASQTAMLDPGYYMYDVLLTDTSSNTVSRILEGKLRVTPEVTR